MIWPGAAEWIDIAYLLRGYFIPHSLKSTTILCCSPCSLDCHAMHYNKNCRYVAAPTGSMKKVWDEITPDEVYDMFSAAPCQIKSIVQNGVCYIE